MTPSMPVGTVRRDRPADILCLIYPGCESASKPINRRSHAKGHGEHLLSTKGGTAVFSSRFLVFSELPGKGRTRRTSTPFLIREGARRGAKNTLFCPRRAAKNSEDLWEVSCVNALASLILFRQIAVQAKVNEPSSPSRFPDCGRPGDLPYSRSTPKRGPFDGLLQFNL